MSNTAVVTDIQRFSLNDGPGIRTTVFFKGCNMNCAWCHNPETIKPKQDILYNKSKCIGCYKCVYACPSKAHKRINGEHRFFPNLCIKCGKCASICFAGSMEATAKTKTIDDIMFEIVQDKSYYKSSKGGVTLSGGEVLCQKEFANSLIEACHNEDINVGLETALNFPTDAIAPVLNAADIIMCDLKIFNDADHKKWTGVSNKNILENIAYIDTIGVPYIVRTPLIPGATDSDENIKAIADFLSTLNSGSRMYYELLNFNPLGASKYDSMGKKNQFKDAKPLPRTRIMELKTLSEEYGLKVRIE